MTDMDRIIRDLRSRIAELEETILQLRESIATRDQHWPDAWKLRPGEAAILVALFTAADGFRTKHALHVACSRAGNPETDQKIVHVYITQLRQKLRLHVSVEIKSVWGRGYQIIGESKEVLARHLIAKKMAA